MPPPFNLVPTFKSLFRITGGCTGDSSKKGADAKAREVAEKR